MEYGLRVKKLSTRASHSESEVESDCESVSSAVSVVHCTARNQQNEFYQRKKVRMCPTTKTVHCLTQTMQLMRERVIDVASQAIQCRQMVQQNVKFVKFHKVPCSLKSSIKFRNFSSIVKFVQFVRNNYGFKVQTKAVTMGHREVAFQRLRDYHAGILLRYANDLLPRDIFRSTLAKPWRN